MRRTDWRKYILFVLAILLGVSAGVITVLLIPAGYKEFNGLAFFVVAFLVAAATLFLGVKIFRIGEDD